METSVFLAAVVRLLPTNTPPLPLFNIWTVLWESLGSDSVDPLTTLMVSAVMRHQVARRGSNGLGSVCTQYIPRLISKVVRRKGTDLDLKKNARRLPFYAKCLFREIQFKGKWNSFLTIWTDLTWNPPTPDVQYHIQDFKLSLCFFYFREEIFFYFKCVSFLHTLEDHFCALPPHPCWKIIKPPLQPNPDRWRLWL